MSPAIEGDDDFLAGDRWQFERQGRTFRHGGLTLLDRMLLFVGPQSSGDEVVCMRRRDLVLAFGAASLGGARRLHAQPLPARVGMMFWGDRTVSAAVFTEIANGLAALGHREGANLAIEIRWAEFSRERAEHQARELAARCAVIVAQGPASFAAAVVAPQVPLVIAFSGDPVEAGFTSGWTQPDKGITGISFLA